MQHPPNPIGRGLFLMMVLYICLFLALGALLVNNVGCAGLDVRQGLGQRDQFERLSPVDGELRFSMDGTQKQQTLIAEGEIFMDENGRPDPTRSRFTKIFWRTSEPTDVTARAYQSGVETIGRVSEKAIDLVGAGLRIYGGSRPTRSQPAPPANPSERGP